MSFKKLAEAVMKCDNGLHLGDGSGSGESELGCVLEVEMTGPCNKCGGSRKGRKQRCLNNWVDSGAAY